MERTLTVLGDYRRTMTAFGVERARLIATSAVRDAKNGQEFLSAATETVGVQAELLSGDEEGRLSFNGATAELRDSGEDVVVIDIGGGSTELAARLGGQFHSVSLDIGCVRLTERVMRHDPPSADEIDEATRTVLRALGEARRQIPGLAQLSPACRFLGLAGTVSTLTMLERGLTAYDHDRIHHAVLTSEAVAGWTAMLLGDSSRQRIERGILDPGRADVIAAGALILTTVMSDLGLDSCTTSEADILDGLVRSLRVGET